MNPWHQESVSLHGAPEHRPGGECESPVKALSSTAEVLQLERPKMPCWDTGCWATAPLPDPAGAGPGNCISNKIPGQAHAASPGPQFENQRPEGYTIENICFSSKGKYL